MYRRTGLPFASLWSFIRRLRPLLCSLFFFFFLVGRFLRKGWRWRIFGSLYIIMPFLYLNLSLWTRLPEQKFTYELVADDNLGPITPKWICAQKPFVKTQVDFCSRPYAIHREAISIGLREVLLNCTLDSFGNPVNLAFIRAGRGHF